MIPFRGAGPTADAIATFHGDNGSGKSSALAALDLFFGIVRFHGRYGGEIVGRDMPVSDRPSLFIPHRDRPLESEEPTTIDVRFEDARAGASRVQLTFSGDRMQVSVSPLAGTQGVNPIQDWTPFGPGSRPLAIVNARRGASWLEEKFSGYGAALIEDLFDHRTSLRVDLRERWRAFVGVLQRFPMFANKEISVDRIEANGPPELRFEERGRNVLRLDELSSGEQQMVLLSAAVMVANAAIVAVEEPELSLDFKNQRLLRDLLEAQIDAGLVDQIILESHVPSFDGPDVIRFHREPGGASTVTREPATRTETSALAGAARAQGAKPCWVTADGYTQVPDAMRDDLRVGNGRHIWFLHGPERWEVWPEDDINEMLGAEPEGGDA